MKATSWRSGQNIALCAGGSGFVSRAGQIGHSVTTAAMFVRSCVVQTLSRVDGSRRSLHTSASYREYNESLMFFLVKTTISIIPTVQKVITRAIFY